jgi:hypothetical protein
MDQEALDFYEYLTGPKDKTSEDDLDIPDDVVVEEEEEEELSDDEDENDEDESPASDD